MHPTHRDLRLDSVTYMVKILFITDQYLLLRCRFDPKRQEPFII